MEEIREMLEWAGQRLLALNVAKPGPKAPHVAWPLYAQDKHTAYGYTGERLRPASPSSAEVDLMDEILTLPALISDPTVRRIVNSRALVTPLAGRHLYSWSRLAFMLHLDRRTVHRLHAAGLAEIARRARQEKMDAIRHSLATIC